MKNKIFVAASSVILIALALFTNFSNGKINKVRADSYCCPEEGSGCMSKTGAIYYDHYLKIDNPCDS